MFQFEAGHFAIAGLIAAVAPLVIHLLNQRQFRTVSWGAVEFLRKAIERHRKFFRLRDLLLLAVRVFVVVLFGLALAQPYLKGSFWSATSSLLLAAVIIAIGIAAGVVSVTHTENRLRRLASGVGVACLVAAIGLAFWQSNRGADASDRSNAATFQHPVHALVAIDNSRSMQTTSGAETRLTLAKRKVSEFLKRLPPGSRYTILPFTRDLSAPSATVHRNLNAAETALNDILATDTLGVPQVVLEQALAIAKQTTDVPTKRFVIVSDLQATNWSPPAVAPVIRQLSDLQIVPVGDPAVTEANLAVTGVEVDDGFAVEGATGRMTVRVTAGELPGPTGASLEIRVGGVSAGGRLVELTSGQSTEIDFFHPFLSSGGASADSGVPNSETGDRFVAIEAQLTPLVGTSDLLSSDNRLTKLVPFVRELPVLFVDSLGRGENPVGGVYGESFALRQLLLVGGNPTNNMSSEESPTPAVASGNVIQTRHITPGELHIDTLRDARLVVIAGIESPGGAVPLLREYVQQGGTLLITAGGEFDPDLWNRLAWQSGSGILPCPLEAGFEGVTPEEDPTGLKPFHLAFNTLDLDQFGFPGESTVALQDLYESAIFFKAIRATAKLDRAEQSLIGAPAGATGRQKTADEAPEPNWWRWRQSLSPSRSSSRGGLDLSPGNSGRARVLARFRENELPYAVELPIGRGKVVLVTSSLTSNWNLLRSSPAVAWLAKLAYGSIATTFPQRNFEPGNPVRLPVDAPGVRRWKIERPAGQPVFVAPEQLSDTVKGLSVVQTESAGLYALAPADASGRADQGRAVAESVSRATEFAVQTDPRESLLAPVQVSVLQDALVGTNASILLPDEPIRLVGGGRYAQGLWKLLMLLVLVALLLEMALLARTQVPSGQIPSARSPLVSSLATERKEAPV